MAKRQPGRRRLKIAVTVEPALLERIERLAKAKGQNRSRFIEELIRDQIDQEELTVKALTDPVIGPALAGMFARPDILRAMTAQLRQDMTDEQLKLFTGSIEAAMGGLGAAVPKTGQAAETPAAGKKRRKS